jgi:hypothetical protein
MRPAISFQRNKSSITLKGIEMEHEGNVENVELTYRQVDRVERAAPR